MKPVDKIGTRSLKNAKFKFLGELNDLLPVGKRDKVISCQFKGNPTVKHLIEALGIPHTEIGEVFVEHREVELSQKLEDNNEVLVKPYKYRVSGNYIDYRFLDENGIPRFILDNHLGKLAVKLRILGLDAEYENNYEDEHLAEITSKGDRILLTRDRGLLKRKKVVYGYLIRNIDPMLQLNEVITRYRLGKNFRPFQRCLICNKILQKVDKEEILDRLEPLTRKYYDEFHYCEGCDRVYWKGSHYLRMLEFIENL